MRARALAALLICLAAAVWPWAPYFLDRENTLLTNRHWFTRERQLAKETFKTLSYLREPQTLSGQRLNLHAWGGYQEALYRSKLQPAALAFDFYVQPDSYVIALFDTDWDGFQGIRLSGSGTYPSAYLAGDGAGNFLIKNPFPTPLLAEAGWHHAQLHFPEGRLDVTVDDAPLAQFPVALHGLRWVGFRGSANPSMVDNFEVRDATSGRWYRDRFAPPGNGWRAWANAYFVGLLLLLVLVPVCRVLSGDWRSAVAWSTSISLCLAAAGLTLLAFNTWILSARYPTAAQYAEVENRRVERGTRLVGEKLAEQHAQKPAPGTFRILVLGTSQTFGCGAGRTDSDFVSLLDRKLNAAFQQHPPIEVLNAGVPGSDSGRLVRAYEESWIDFSPDLTLVNLSCNDQMYGDAQFAEHLQRLVRLNERRGIRTVFSLEPLSYEEVPEEMQTHIRMREVASTFGIPCVETFALMQAHRDEGLLWWDVIHPSDAGHARIADILAPELIAEIEVMP